MFDESRQLLLIIGFWGHFTHRDVNIDVQSCSGKKNVTAARSTSSTTSPVVANTIISFTS
jgi:hypothetical protein